ncbi:MAG: TM2 domain-containing protein [Firmicutes bacterium]|nr:TM2 domain-containing protein [Bacillota bacterium]
MSEKYCPNCGTAVTETMKFCPNCGIRVEGLFEEVRQQSETRQGPSFDGQQGQAYQYANYNADYSAMNSVDPNWPVRSKIAAGVLGIVLGGLGIHKFYLGKIGLGIVYILFVWTGIPSFIGLVEGIIYLCTDDLTFQLKHRVRLE